MAYFFQNLQDDNFSLNLGDNVDITSSMGYANHVIDGNAYGLFSNMNNYNAPFKIPDSLQDASNMFYYCPNFNSPIYIDPYNSQLTNMCYMVSYCNSFSQDINVPVNCYRFNQFAPVTVYDWDISGYPLPIYNANLNIYCPRGIYNTENYYDWALASLMGFNGNVHFVNVTPTYLYDFLAYSYSFNGNVQIPDTVNIMDYCFYECYTLNQNIQIPSSVTNMEYCFARCYNLNQNILLPNNINGANCFQACNNLNQRIRIPFNSNIKHMFMGCEQLNQPMDIPFYDSEVNYDWERYFPASCNGSGLFYGCYNLNSIITINDNIEIMDNTFNYCNSLNQPITMPSHLKVANSVFSTTRMNQNIVFPEGMLQMVNVFQNSAMNCNIQIPSTVLYLDACFSGSPINQNIAIPEGCLSTRSLFSGCKNLNQNIYIPSSVEDVDSMFYGCHNLNQNILIPNGVNSISSMFYECFNLELPLVNIPPSVQSCGMAFGYTKIMNINIQGETMSSFGTLITLYYGANTAGATPSNCNLESALTNYEDIDWGTPIGCMRINASLEERINTVSNLNRIVGGKGPYNNYDAYKNQMDWINNSYEAHTYWWNYYMQYYNHGRMMIAAHSNGLYSYDDIHIMYLDYPNAISDADTKWYWYNISFW